MVSLLFSVWGKESKLFKRGREGMFILTNRRIAFVSKTKMSMEWWRDEVENQMKHFKKSNTTIRKSEYYTMERLMRDLENENNMNIELTQVASVKSEKKEWGTQLILKFGDKEKVKTYTFAVVKTWTSYPVKDPLTFLHVDWQPLVNAIASHM